MPGSIAIGDIQLTPISGGRLWIDGGSMFGVVPRVLWERKSPPDERNRVLLATNCILVRAAGSLGLIDTGYGGKASPKFRRRHSLEEGAPLTRSLAAEGVAPEQIDWVILTHLHFDHAGGCTYRDEEDRLRPAFPKARHFIQRKEWDDAVGNLPELADAYYLDDFLPLEEAGLVDLVEDAAEIVPGVAVRLTGGHTRGHQMVDIQSGDASAVCLGDICPTTAHLPTFWTMAYDQFPLDVRRRKPGVLADVAEHGRIALFSHDPHIAAARLRQDSEGNFEAEPLGELH